jgi:hypothetical protein
VFQLGSAKSSNGEVAEVLTCRIPVSFRGAFDRAAHLVRQDYTMSGQRHHRGGSGPLSVRLA